MSAIVDFYKAVGFKWDEEQHPRDEVGRFAESEGGGVSYDL